MSHVNSLHQTVDLDFFSSGFPSCKLTVCPRILLNLFFSFILTKEQLFLQKKDLLPPFFSNQIKAVLHLNVRRSLAKNLKGEIKIHQAINDKVSIQYFMQATASIFKSCLENLMDMRIFSFFLFFVCKRCFCWDAQVCRV